MATLLRWRRYLPLSCFRFLHDTILEQPSMSPSLRSPIRHHALWACSGITAPELRFRGMPQASRSARAEVWGAEDRKPWTRNIHSGGQQEEIQEPEKEKGGVSSGKLVLYRAKWIRPIRLLVRLKLIQFGGVVALAIPLAEYSQQGSLSLGTTLAVGAVVGGAGAASAALWYYSRRLVGEMALILPDLRVMQISVLDFWGNREDLHYDVSDILPPLKGMSTEELGRAAQQIVIPLDVLGGRQFFLSLRHGHLVHEDILFSILNGSIEARDFKNVDASV